VDTLASSCNEGTESNHSPPFPCRRHRRKPRESPAGNVHAGRRRSPTHGGGRSRHRRGNPGDRSDPLVTASGRTVATRRASKGRARGSAPPPFCGGHIRLLGHQPALLERPRRHVADGPDPGGSPHAARDEPVVVVREPRQRRTAQARQRDDEIDVERASSSSQSLPSSTSSGNAPVRTRMPANATRRATASLAAPPKTPSGADSGVTTLDRKVEAVTHRALGRQERELVERERPAGSGPPRTLARIRAPARRCRRGSSGPRDPALSRATRSAPALLAERLRDRARRRLPSGATPRTTAVFPQH